MIFNLIFNLIFKLSCAGTYTYIVSYQLHYNISICKRTRVHKWGLALSHIFIIMSHLISLTMDRGLQLGAIVDVSIYLYCACLFIWELVRVTDGQSIVHTVTIPTASIFYQPSLVEIRTSLSMLLRLEYRHVNMDEKPAKL